ncbi:hypothetical protein GAGA_3167 [Paraglaciecola agarilytica NO2]|uniref:Uncharacterized protein n=1 Tax=Paraglaciecola agarilytica NO2 TaxID=1125747 RepID=A0ABQ0I9F1_9ALTE|nr:hypothetical protein GAGA_3167 [Paraglaciecola agarilytica NO2]
MSYAHGAQLRCLCAVLTYAHCLFMACGHYPLRLTYELRSQSTASLLMRYAYRHP